MTLDLTQIAADEQQRFDAATTPIQRKRLGHFGTHRAVADFMAAMFAAFPDTTVQILDPGAGVGTLSAALCQRVALERRPRRLAFELWENNPSLETHLRATMAGCQTALASAGHEMSFVIRTDDFVLAHSRPSLFEAARQPKFHMAVMNPPYFKLAKDSAHARATPHVVHGQPNIYALFMAVAADLLIDGGELVAITPRSYFNGPYFRRFRRWFFDRMTARQIHVFESRSEAFQNDAVLQENVILLARKSVAPGTVTLTTSAGRSFDKVSREVVSYSRVIDNASPDRIIRLAANRLEHDAVDAVDRLPCRFRELGFEISTGPVVPFRAEHLLRHERGEDTAPLFWMQNVRPFEVLPAHGKNGKPAHVLVSDESTRLLLPSKRYVLLKRFSSKEERRRLVAGIMEAENSYSRLVGLENHLNYVYRPKSELSRDEALGLAALFNSAVVDRYFRAISGSTQVNAAEIRAMPLPGIDVICRLGRLVDRMETKSPTQIERIVGQTIGLGDDLVARLCETCE